MRRWKILFCLINSTQYSEQLEQFFMFLSISGIQYSFLNLKIYTYSFIWPTRNVLFLLLMSYYCIIYKEINYFIVNIIYRIYYNGWYFMYNCRINLKKKNFCTLFFHGTIFCYTIFQNKSFLFSKHIYGCWWN